MKINSVLHTFVNGEHTTRYMSYTPAQFKARFGFSVDEFVAKLRARDLRERLERMGVINVDRYLPGDTEDRTDYSRAHDDNLHHESLDHPLTPIDRAWNKVKPDYMATLSPREQLFYAEYQKISAEFEAAKARRPSPGQFRWATKKGKQVLALNEMATPHLFYSLRMIFNNTVPPPFRVGKFIE